MSTPSGDAVREEIRENALVMGNPVKESTKLPVTVANVLSVNASGVLEDIVPVPVNASAITDSLIALGGTPNGNIMTQTLVAAASATTFTGAGWMRISIVSGNDALLSTGAYYVPFGTLT
jgi:hypothetical protein